MAWKVKNEKLELKLRFQNVQELARFISVLAPVIDAENHHPDMEINHVTLTLWLFTYDLNRISERDYAMAGKILSLVADSNGVLE